MPITVLQWVGCRIPSKPTGVSIAEIRQIPEPKRISISSPEAPVADGIVPIYFDIDERTGKSRQTITLRLDYFPEGKADSTQRVLPRCIKPFAADSEVGTVACQGKEGSRQPLLAGMVEQACYTDPKAEKAASQKPLLISQCRRGVLLIHGFEPRLKFDIEQRDVN